MTAESARAMPKWRRDLRLARSIAAGRGFQCLVQVTNRCNMRCGFCEFWSHPAKPSDELSVGDYRRLARDLSSEGGYIVSIEGGEPTLRPDLPAIVEAFSSLHHTVLYTNGWYVTPDRARELFARGLGHVAVSIDFPGPEHDGFRGVRGAFERATEAARLLREAAPRGGRQVHLMTVVMRQNQGDLEELLRLSRDLGVGHMVTLLSREGFRRGRCDGATAPDPAVGAELARLKRRYPHFLAYSRYLEGFEPFLSGGRMPTCQAGELSFNVDHLGDVSVCIEKIDRPVGNVRRESWGEIRARLRGMREEVAACQSCWTLCRGFNQVYGAPSLRSWRELAALR